MNTVESRPASILLVDDEPKNIQLLGNLLHEQGYLIEFATSGEETMQWLRVRSFDLILLDVMMPGMDGYEVCQWLKSQPSSRMIPVIFLTAKTDAESVVKGFDLGAVDYITKPFQKDELLARVNTHITLLHQQRALDEYAALLADKNRELQQKNVQLEALNASKDKFFSIIAHDLRSPLSSLLSFAHILEQFEQIKPGDMTILTQQFRISAENLFKLLENLLTWARMQHGLIEYNQSQIEIGEIITHNISLQTPNAAQKQIRLIYAPQRAFSVYIDVHMIDTVIRNLLSNAIKFTHPDGAVEISTTMIDDVVRVAISDNGIGIPAENIGQLFRIDSRIKQDGTAGEKGTGLGLILCKEFVEKNGGTIWAESQPGHGATFFFTLPAANE